MDEQTLGDSPSVDERLANFFSAPEAAPENEETAEAPQADEEPAEQTEAAEEGEDFEVDGEQYKLPPALKAKVTEWREGALRREDYTRKTQEVSELHRQVAAMSEAANASNHFEQSIADEKGELARVKHQLEAYKGLDWQNLEVEQYIKLKGQMDTLRDRAQELDASINGKRQQFDKFVQSKKAEIVAAGQKYLQQSIKGWGPEAVKEVAASAKEVGYSDAELESVLDARFVRLAWKAAQFDKLQAGKSAAVEAVKKAPPVVKPGVTNHGAAEQNKYKELRAALKKTGDPRIAQRLLEMRFK